MPSQILSLKPDSELVFRGPFDRVVTTTLRLSNPVADQPVAFKVKTTAPKRYCVRPNSGLIQAGGEVEVAVMLQPSAGDQSDTAEQRSRHKFMVQSLLMPARTPPNLAGAALDEAWRSASSDKLMDSKLRVVQIEADGVANASAPSPNQPGPAAANSAPSDLPKNAHEMQQELQRLRDENSRLAEQDLRLRKLAMRPSPPSSPSGSANVSSASGSTAVATARGPLVPPALFLVLAMVLGLVVGKRCARGPQPSDNADNGQMCNRQLSRSYCAAHLKAAYGSMVTGNRTVGRVRSVYRGRGAANHRLRRLLRRRADALGRNLQQGRRRQPPAAVGAAFAGVTGASLESPAPNTADSGVPARLGSAAGSLPPTVELCEQLEGVQLLRLRQVGLQLQILVLELPAGNISLRSREALNMKTLLNILISVAADGGSE
uniref:MSP domain-containing protein n=1 Tax=Macrostomum lignano TaxID=282301 RepID=A0A1I8I184_9PLAT